jgi:hypothetical protein
MYKRILSNLKRRDQPWGPPGLSYSLTAEGTFKATGGGGVGHPHPFTVEVKSAWSFASLCPVCLHGLHGDCNVLFPPNSVFDAGVMPAPLQRLRLFLREN